MVPTSSRAARTLAAPVSCAADGMARPKTSKTVASKRIMTSPLNLNGTWNGLDVQAGFTLRQPDASARDPSLTRRVGAAESDTFISVRLSIGALAQLFGERAGLTGDVKAGRQLDEPQPRHVGHGAQGVVNADVVAQR